VTTKRELERLARKAFGQLASASEGPITSGAWSCEGAVSVDCDDDRDRREMLAAALRGIIAWKEGKR
jgi:hypothetical protein